MKSFFAEIKLFVALGFSALLFCFLVTGMAVRSNIRSKSDERNNSILIGNSHPQCAVNDSLITGLVNLCTSGESYFWTYHKLKIVYESNPHIEHVILGISDNQMGPIMDTAIWSDKYLAKRLSAYLHFISLNEYPYFLKFNPTGFIKKSIGSIWKNASKLALFKHQFDDLGGFLALDKKLEINSTNSFPRKDSNSTAKKNLEYLMKIVEYCKVEDLELSLLITPKHKEYLNPYQVVEFINSRKKKGDEFYVLDYKTFPLPDTCFADLEHLNMEGAKRFTLALNERLLTKKYD